MLFSRKFCRLAMNFVIDCSQQIKSTWAVFIIYRGNRRKFSLGDIFADRKQHFHYSTKKNAKQRKYHPAKNCMKSDNDIEKTDGRTKNVVVKSFFFFSNSLVLPFGLISLKYFRW